MGFLRELGAVRLVRPHPDRAAPARAWLRARPVPTLAPTCADAEPAEPTEPNQENQPALFRTGKEYPVPHKSRPITRQAQTHNGRKLITARVESSPQWHRIFGEYGDRYDQTETVELARFRHLDDVTIYMALIGFPIHR